MAELTVSVRMPKSEFTEAAHRQRQAWQGGIVHLHHHLHRHASICTIIPVGTIISIVGDRAGSKTTRPPGASELPDKEASGIALGWRGGLQWQASVRGGEHAGWRVI